MVGTHLRLASGVVVPTAASVELAAVVAAAVAAETTSVAAVAADGAALAAVAAVAAAVAAAVVSLAPPPRLSPVGNVEGLLLAVAPEADGVDVICFLFAVEGGCEGRRRLGRLRRGC